MGAHHPERISNTKLFYDSGSRGINVEANPELHKIFLEERPEDINLNVSFTLYTYDGVNNSVPISSQVITTTTNVYRAYQVIRPALSQDVDNPDFGNAGDNGVVPGGINQINPGQDEVLGIIWVRSPLTPQNPTTPKYSFISKPFSGPQPVDLTFNRNFVINVDNADYSINDKIGFRLFIESNAGIVTSSVLTTNDSILQAIPSNNSLLVTTSSICVDQAANSFYLSTQLSPK